MSKNSNLILFLVFFASFLLLILTKLEYVVEFSQTKPDTNISSFVSNAHAALLDAQMLGFLMVVLAGGSVFFLYKLLKK